MGTGKSVTGRLLQMRVPYYAQADFTIATDNLSELEVIGTIEE